MAPTWVEAKHLEYLCERLEAVERGEVKRLIVNMPPGFAKSFIVSRCFPVWLLMRNPMIEFLLNSYGDDLAEEHSAAAREMYEHWAPQITGKSVDTRSKAVDRWLVHVGGGRMGGGMRACGILSAVTGRRADIAVVDDPYKNWKEASSQTHRDMVYAAYLSCIRTRLKKGGRIVLVHTRWHDDDLTGRLVRAMEEEDGEKWEVVTFPAVASENDILGRSPGDPLWPGMYDAEELDNIKKGVSAGADGQIGSGYFWDSLYQQQPRKMEGKMFKRDWFRYFWEDGDFYVLGGEDGEYRYHKSECATFQTVDVAATKEQENDYTVCSTWTLCPGSELLLRGVYRERIKTTEHLSMLWEQFLRWYPGSQFVENKTFGLNVIQAGIVEGLPIIAVPADMDKVSRSLLMQAKYQNGYVYHLRNAPWLTPIENELLDFPGKHDDFVDTASIAGIQSVELSCGLSAMPSVGGSERLGNGGWEPSNESLWPS